MKNEKEFWQVVLKVLDIVQESVWFMHVIKLVTTVGLLLLAMLQA